MLTHTCGKMPGCFADITGITARTCKLINHTRTKPVRDRVFHAKHGAGYHGKTCGWWENNVYQKLMFENFSSVEQTSSNMDAKRSKIVESTNVLQRKERLAPGFYNMKITHVSRAYATRCSGVLGSRCQRRCCGERTGTVEVEKSTFWSKQFEL